MANPLTPEEIHAWINQETEREAQKKIDDKAAEKAGKRLAKQIDASILAEIKGEAPRDFLKGFDPRRHNSSKPSKTSKSLGAIVRLRTNGNEDQVDFFMKLAAGEIKGSTVKDQADAHRWLADRGAGRAPETVVNIEGTVNPLEDLETEEIRAALIEITTKKFR